jgi:hypothetical protein
MTNSEEQDKKLMMILCWGWQDFYKFTAQKRARQKWLIT